MLKGTCADRFVLIGTCATREHAQRGLLATSIIIATADEASCTSFLCSDTSSGVAGGNSQRQQLITFKVGQMQHACLVHPVVLAAFKEGVKQVGEVCDGALSFG